MTHHVLCPVSTILMPTHQVQCPVSTNNSIKFCGIGLKNLTQMHLNAHSYSPYCMVSSQINQFQSQDYKRLQQLARKFQQKAVTHSEAEEGQPDYIARIVEFFETVDKQLFFSAQWFFRAADTVIKSQAHLIDPQRVFYSKRKYDNLLNSIVSKVTIVQLPPDVDLAKKEKSHKLFDYYYDTQYSKSVTFTTPHTVFVTLSRHAFQGIGSQDLSMLLMIAPLALGHIEIQVVDILISVPYAEMRLDLIIVRDFEPTCISGNSCVILGIQFTQVFMLIFSEKQWKVRAIDKDIC
ncbi:chromomethylase 1 [Artemisia annua]|uniref:Chromomethylase 1 n=1 Tax=Artemisia annua TaxID=35608 RepID=A0A2U1QLE2_ARTAN|nr:chromomethylase 1 [Artemisia annua]